MEIDPDKRICIVWNLSQSIILILSAALAIAAWSSYLVEQQYDAASLRLLLIGKSMATSIGAQYKRMLLGHFLWLLL